MTFDSARLRWNGWGPREDAMAEPAWHWLAQALGMPALLATPPRALEDVAMPPSRLAADVKAKLTALVGEEQLRDDARMRAAHAAGRSLADLLKLRGGDLARAPDAVVWPRSEDEVLALLSFAAASDIALVPFGGGTSMVGGVTPSRGTHKAVVTLDMTRMARVLDVDPVSGLARAEAGITGPDLDRQLAARGMVLGHWPDSFEFSTLGGWIAHHGTGQEASRYGRAADWLAGVRLATPRGLITSIGQSAAGPDLRQIVLGSDGTLGVITGATLRVQPMPAREEYRAFLFPDFASGLTAVREALRNGVPHTMLRLSDAGDTRTFAAMAEAGEGFRLGARLRGIYHQVRRFDGNAARLVAGFAGSAGEVAAARRRLDAIAGKLGAMPLGRDRHWSEQRFVFGYRRDTLLDHGVGMDMIESFATWSRLPALYAGVRTALDQAMRRHVPREGAHGLVLAHLTVARHEGAGLNFTYLYPRQLDDEVEQALAIRRAGLDAALSQGATISHAFGAGEDYLPWMEKEKSAAGMETLRAIKRALDPQGILNPGKLAP